jgi:hypothetical protein
MEEIDFVVNQVAVALWHAVNFCRLADPDLVQGMLFLKFGQVFIAQLCRPAVDLITLGLRARILRRVGQG